MTKFATCDFAASGCNYPEGECLGLCAWKPLPCFARNPRRIQNARRPYGTTGNGSKLPSLGAYRGRERRYRLPRKIIL